MSEHIEHTALHDSPSSDAEQPSTATVSFIGPRSHYARHIGSLPPRFLDQLIEKSSPELNSIIDKHLPLNQRQRVVIAAVFDRLAKLDNDEAYDYASFLSHRAHNLLTNMASDGEISVTDFMSVLDETTCAISQFIEYFAPSDLQPPAHTAQ